MRDSESRATLIAAFIEDWYMANIEWILLIWLGLLGGCIGSFLNVVIYRLPAGKNLMWPGSHCPNCGHRIRAFHNIPVFGWLLLRGKCYDCRVRISPRYPLVELATAVLFASLAWFIFLIDRDLSRNAFADHRRWALYGGLLVSLLSLACMAMIQRDGGKVPRVFYYIALAGTLAAALATWWRPGG